MPLTGDSTSPTDGDDRTDVDRLFEALAHGERRTVATALVESDRATVGDLASRISEDDRDRRRARIDLVHRHLPKLTAAGVVEYDRESGRVAMAEDAAADVRALLAMARE